MKQFFWRAGLVVVSGLVLGTGVGATALTTAAGAARGTQAAASTPPCKTATYTIAVSSQSAWSLSISGQVDFSADAATADVTLPSSFPISFLAGSTVQLVLVGGTAYVSLPPALAGFVGGGSWVSIALPSGLNTALDGLLARLAGFCGSPQSTVGSLSARRHSPTSLGSSSIGGVPVTGTHLNAPAKRFKKTFGVTKAVASGQWQVGGRPVPVTVWVNDQGQLAQASITLPNISITITVTNIDQPANIAAPPGATPLSPSLVSWLGGFLGSGSGW